MQCKVSDVQVQRHNSAQPANEVGRLARPNKKATKSTARRFRLVSSVMAAAVIAATSAVHAAGVTYTYTGAGPDANWNDSSNWSNTTIIPGFPGSGDIANIAGTLNTSISLNGAQQVNTINFTDTNPFTISGTSLTVDDGGSINKTVTTYSTTDLDIISAPITFVGAATISSNITGGQQGNTTQTPIQLNGALTGSGLITFTGGWGVRLGANNTAFGGNFSLTNGVGIILAATNALGPATSTTTLGTGTKIALSGGTLANKWVIAGNAVETSYGGSTTLSGDVAINSGTFTLDQGGGNSVNFSGAISGAGNMAITFGGFIFSGATSNSWGGTTTASSTSGSAGFNTYTLAKTGGAIAIPGTGQVLTLSNNAIFAWSGSEQLSSTLVPALNGANNQFKLQGFTQTLGGITGIGAIGSESANKASTLNLTVTGANSYSFSGTLRDGSTTGLGTLTVNKAGSGTQILAGTNTYTGPTTITGGTLALSAGTAGTSTNNIASSSAINLAANSTLDTTALAGSTIALSATQPLNITGTGTANITGGLSVGSSMVNMQDTTVSKLNLTSFLSVNSSTFKFDLGQTTGDSITTPSSVNGVGTNVISVDAFASDTSLASSYVLITASSGMAGTFTLSQNQLIVGGTTYNLSLSSTPTSEILNATSASAPEPSSLATLGIVATGLLIRRRRKSLILG